MADYQFEKTIYDWMLPLALVLTIYFGWLLISVAKELRKLNSSDDPGPVAVILLSLFGALSLPQLQRHLNRAISIRTGKLA